MTSLPDPSEPSHRPLQEPEALPDDARPESWKDALATLLTTRLDLIRLESGEAARGGARKVLMLVTAAFCALCSWALGLTAAIGAITAASGWPWFGVTAIAAGVHILVGAALVLAAKSPGEPSFPVTRAEFQKDREWLESLRKNPKSND